MVEGEIITTFEPLNLFDAFGADEIGRFLGIALMGIFVLQRGGFENFTRREQGANVVIGMITLALLLPLMPLAGRSFLTGVLYWAAIPLILGLGVPAICRLAIGRFPARRADVVSSTSTG